MHPDLTLKIYKYFIKSKLEYGTITSEQLTHSFKHMKLLDKAQ